MNLETALQIQNCQCIAQVKLPSKTKMQKHIFKQAVKISKNNFSTYSFTSSLFLPELKLLSYTFGDMQYM